MQSRTLDVLFEDNHLLAINKPAGIPTQGARPGDSSVVQLAKQYIKSRFNKPGNVYLGVVSRLDSPVSGVLVLARTSKAAARLTSQFARREPRKIYWAIVEQEPIPAAGSCLDWLAHVEPLRRMKVVPQASGEGKEARLTYRTLKSMSTGWLVEVELETGRKHQIRVQLSSRGWPIAGDKKYQATLDWPHGIALHARQLELLHPVRGTPLVLTAPLPTIWPRDN